jgi:carboxypeptidase Taq
MSLDALRARLSELADLDAAASVLAWDQRTMMPAAGAATRASQMATLERLSHERFTSDDVGAWLEDADPGDDPIAADLIRVARRDYDKARRVPSDLAADLARASIDGEQAWLTARAKADFSLLAPHLRRQLELRGEYVACFPEVSEPYDALLDDYEPGMRTADVRAAFARLREGLAPLVAEAAEHAGAVDLSPLAGPFPVPAQRRVVDQLLRRVGFDDDAWRLDDAAHPFSAGSGPDDQRITNRYDERTIDSLFSALHEFGHGLYEHQIDRALAGTPLCHGVSMTIHESQSRLWENQVGLSRGFLTLVFGDLREAFPQALGATDADQLWRALNAVRPTLIRVEADEVTYALHVVLRFELELALVHGALDVTDLPAAWNDGMRDLLGLTPPDDAAGVLQDVHWAGGAFGYFPTYALGSAVSAQLWEAMGRDLGDPDELVAAGEFAPIREWLREHVHRLGRRLTPAETLVHATGRPLDVEPQLRRLTAKVHELYR